MVKLRKLHGLQDIKSVKAASDVAENTTVTVSNKNHILSSSWIVCIFLRQKNNNKTHNLSSHYKLSAIFYFFTTTGFPSLYVTHILH